MSTTARLLVGMLVVAGLACGNRSAEVCDEEAKVEVAEATPAEVDAVQVEAKTVEAVPVELVPPPVDEAPADAEAMLEAARTVMFQDPASGYAKAEASYLAAPTRDALFVMGFAACRLQDADKARSTIERFADPGDATRMREHCEKKGVSL